MFERYTESARRAIFFARAESIERSAPEIETSDLLLGLLREPWIGGSAFAQLPARFEEFRTMFGYGPSDLNSSQVPKNLPLSKKSKIALAYAAKEAERDNTGHIDREHLLRGILCTDDDASKKLTQAGVTLESLRSNPGPKVKQPGSFKTGRWLPIRTLILRFLGILGLVVAAVIYLRSQDTP